MSINCSLEERVEALEKQIREVKKGKEMRLIDADELINKIISIDYVPVCVDCMTKHRIKEIIEKQPTAYDLNNMQKQIEVDTVMLHEVLDIINTYEKKNENNRGDSMRHDECNYLNCKVKVEDVIKAVDKHTNEDDTLDDDISCILEEIVNPIFDEQEST